MLGMEYQFRTLTIWLNKFRSGKQSANIVKEVHFI